ncbi:MAG: glycosyl transferase [Rhodothalassiaceae bacterium]|nr:MAG: glycosyl transferase [Rhodothalassiaceae bacterium]
MKHLAPVVVFAYKRPDHLRQTILSLMACDGFDESPIIIYFDGPKNDKEKEATNLTREVAKDLIGNIAEFHFQNRNIGLAKSVIRGVTDVTNRFGRAIIIEDDLILAPGFLRFMNDALDRYADVPRIFQISGFMFDIPEWKHRKTALFLPFTVSWGWATWKRAWDAFDPDATGWEILRHDRALRRRFNLDGNYNYAAMLEDQMAGRIDSWAIRWYWSVFKANGLVLFPPVSLVRNIGMDGSGTHGHGWLWRTRSLMAANFSADCLYFLPHDVRIDPVDVRIVHRNLRHQSGGWISFMRTKFLDLLRL